MDKKVKVQVYLADGNIIEYDVANEKSAREHAHAIVMGGYRQVQDDTLEWFPPHFIKKVKLTPFKGGYYKDTRIIS